MFSQVRGPRGNYIAKGGRALKAGYHMIPSSLSVPERLKRLKRYHNDGKIFLSSTKKQVLSYLPTSPLPRTGLLTCLPTHYAHATEMATGIRALPHGQGRHHRGERIVVVLSRGAGERDRPTPRRLRFAPTVHSHRSLSLSCVSTCLTAPVS